MMKKTFRIGLALLAFVTFVPYVVSANEWKFTDDFATYDSGALDGQGGWAVTNYSGDVDNTVQVSPDASAEITNHNSMIVSQNITPVNSGIFQFRMRHNKSGLFYFYALASDAGGQLLFSIQFTESKGILLEEAQKQVTLLADYNPNQWYLFTIDFSNKRGERGTFKVKIDDGNFGEYSYVDSESTLFDFAQMVFGSESDGEAVSAFGAIEPVSIATTSVTSDLIGDQNVTVSIDGKSISKPDAQHTSASTSTDLDLTASIVRSFLTNSSTTEPLALPELIESTSSSVTADEESTTTATTSSF